MNTDETTETTEQAAPSTDEVTPLPKEKDKAAVAAAEKSAAKPAPKKAAAKPAKDAPPKRQHLLDAAAKASDEFRKARAARDAAITAARADGFVLREISEATGWANQTIRRIIGGGSTD